jgi:hypothetical protein
MAATAGNALNIKSAGIPIFDGTATFTATTTTQYNTLTGGTGNTINNVSTGTTGQVLTSNGNAAQPTYQTLPFTKMPYTDEATNFNAASNNGYFVTANSTATMPASPAQGDIINFIVDSVSGILTITANMGQIIQVGTAISASAGTCVSNKNGDSISLVYRASDTKWISQGAPEGTWTVT